MDRWSKQGRQRAVRGLMAIAMLAATIGVVVYATGIENDNRATSTNPVRKQATDAWNRLRLSKQDMTTVGNLQWPFKSLRARVRSMPIDLERKAAKVLGRPADLDLRFKRSAYVYFSSPGEAMWIVRGATVTCIFRDKVMSAICAPDTYVYRHGLVLQVFQADKKRPQRPTRFLVFGLVPDGIAKATVRIGARPERIPISGNVFFERARRPISVLPLGGGRSSATPHDAR